MIVDDDEMISCVVEDCDELTMAVCQSLLIQNDVGWNGIAVSDGMVVEEEVEIDGDGDWNVMVLGSMGEEDVECGEVDDLETCPPQRPSCFRRSSSFVIGIEWCWRSCWTWCGHLRGRWFRYTWC